MLVLSLRVMANDSTYLNFTAVGGPATVKLEPQLISLEGTVSLQYSTDSCVTWNAYAVNSIINLPEDSTVFFKATTTNNGFSPATHLYFRFVFPSGKKVSADGNIMSLLDSDMQCNYVPGGAFTRLFYGQSKLIKAPALPADSIGQRAYFRMFEGCTSLEKAPDLPATKLSAWCYEEMFSGCKSLIHIPDLPATSIKECCCYKKMFYGCSSLMIDTMPPGIPWSLQAVIPPNTNPWDYMFEKTGGSFKGTPVSGTTYYVSSDTFKISVTINNPGMGYITGLEPKFPGDTVNLTAIPIPGYLFDHWSDGDTSRSVTFIATKDTVLTANFIRDTAMRLVTLVSEDTLMGNVSGGGRGYPYMDSVTITATPKNSFRFDRWSNGDTLPITTIELDKDTMLTAYFVPDLEFRRKNYLHFKAIGGSATVKLYIEELPNIVELQYSTDDCVTWHDLYMPIDSRFPSKFTVDIASLSDGEQVYVKAKHENRLFSVYRDWDYYQFKIKANGNAVVETGGNIMSLMDIYLQRTDVIEYTFANLFMGCDIINTPELPANIVGTKAYYSMFRNCTHLTNISDLPGTILSGNCYQNMFNGCTSLRIDTLPTGKPWMLDFDSTVTLQLYTEFRTFYPNNDAWTDSMFYNTGGPFTDRPRARTTYYISSYQYKVAAFTSDSVMGSVSGNMGWVNYMDTVTLTALPNPGYIFDSWSNGDTSRILTFQASADTILTARFKRNPMQHFVTVMCDKQWGHATGSGVYDHLDSVSFMAIPCPGFVFDNWSTGDTTNTITIEVICDTTLTAYFSIDSAAMKLNTLNFTAVGGPASVRLIQYDTPASISLQYSTDSSTCWNNYPIDSTLQLAAGETVYLKATKANATFSKNEYNYYNFIMTGIVSANGNIMSLLDELMLMDTVPQYAFHYLFENCQSLIKAPELPAMTMSAHCYEGMFSECTSLSYAPDLPATNLAPYCYLDMFYNCSNIRINSTSSSSRQMAILSGKPWSIPADAVAKTDWNKDMLANTGGSFTGDPEIGVTYNIDYMRNVSVSINDSSMGRITGSGFTASLDTVVLSAITNAGYKFAGWGDGNMFPVMSFVVTNDTVLTASFEVDSTYSPVDHVVDTEVFVLAPNPVKAGDCAFICNNAGKVTVELFAIDGKRIRTFETEESTITIDSLTKAGMYLVRLTTTKGKHYTFKLSVH